MEYVPTQPALSPTFIEALPQMAWVTDARGRVVRFNERWLNYFGGTSVHRTTWLSDGLVHPEDLDFVRGRWLAARAVGVDLREQLRLRRFDGEYRWHLIQVGLVRNEEGVAAFWVGTCIDIDQQKRNEQELDFQRRVLVAQGEASLDAIIVISPERRLLWCNQSARELWGIPEEQGPTGAEMKTAAIISAKRALDPEAHLANLEKAYADPESVTRDDVPMADGRVMERFSAPVRSRDGQLLGRINTYRDITDRIQLVRELQHEREQLRATLDRVEALAGTLEQLAATSMQVGDEQLTLRGALALINEQACRLTGARSATTTVSGEPELDEFVDITFRAPDDAPTQADDEVSSVLQAPLRAVDGRRIGAIRLAGRRDGEPFSDAARSVLVQFAQMASSTIKGRLLLARLKDRAQSALALDHVADGVTLVDHDGIVHVWNRAAERITGVRASALVEHHFGDVIPAWEELVRRIPVTDVENGVTGPATLPLDTYHGEVWVSVVGMRFESGTVYAFRDVTDEHRVERMRSEIVATVSHELRTPLTSIYGMALTLQRSSDELDEETRAHLVEIIVQQSGRLETIIDDLLLSSSIESGELRMTSTSMDVAALAREVTAPFLVDLPPETSLHLDVPDEPAWAIGDTDRFRQVLSNLVENAIRYSPDGGRVTVAVRDREPNVLVSVTDQGLGIPYGAQEHVFDRFHRLDPEMTRGIPGTGLGLYISRELARKMGGDVTLDSEPGIGSTFTVRLVHARHA